MRHIMFVLNQLGVVLLAFGFSLLGNPNNLTSDLAIFLTTLFLGTLMLAGSLWWMIDNVVKNKIFTRQYATYKFILLFTCEVGLSFISTGLSYLTNGNILAGGIYIVISVVIVLLTSSGLTLFKHIFFNFEK